MLLSKSELIRMANLALMGQIELLSTESLEDDDALFFWMMYNIGGAVAAGMLSKEGGRAAVISANRRFDRLCAKFGWGRRMQQEVINDRLLYSVTCDEVSRELQKEEPDALRVMEALIKALDCLTRNHVYLSMFKEACQNEQFKKDCQNAVLDNSDKLCEQFVGKIHPEDYFHMLEDFYKTTVKDGAAGWYLEFGERSPVPDWDKHEDTKQLRNSIKKMYEVRPYL